MGLHWDERDSQPGITGAAHLVGLTGLAANCQISGDNPRGVTVVPTKLTR